MKCNMLELVVTILSFGIICKFRFALDISYSFLINQPTPTHPPSFISINTIKL